MTIPPPLCHIKGQGLRLGSGIPVISLEDKWVQIIFVNRLVNMFTLILIQSKQRKRHFSSKFHQHQLDIFSKISVSKPLENKRIKIRI